MHPFEPFQGIVFRKPNRASTRWFFFDPRIGRCIAERAASRYYR
jgi:hypothetical protein